MKVVAMAGRMQTGKDTVSDMLTGDGYQRVAFADPLKRIAARVFLFSEAQLWGDLKEAQHPGSANNDYWNDVYYRGGLAAKSIYEQYFSGLPESHVYLAWKDFLDLCYGQRFYFTPRFALQRLGTEFGRRLDPNVWIRDTFRSINALRRGEGGYDRSWGITPEPQDPPKAVIITDLRFPNEAQYTKGHQGQVYWIDASKRMIIPPSMHESEPDREAFGNLIETNIDNNGTLEDLRRNLQTIGLLSTGATPSGS